MSLRAILAAALCLTAGAACAKARQPPEHLASDEGNEVAFLIRAGTAESLATASLLAHLIPGADEDEAAGSAGRPQPSQLIRRAVALAPDRPELIWLELRDCQQQQCPDEANIAGRLKQLDPDNGLAWLADLNAAQRVSAAEVTQAIAKIGEAREPRLYWNKLAAMMFEALTHHDRTQPPTAITRDADDRLSHATGVLAAVDVPAFRGLAHACRPEEFAASGRREACAQVASRFQTSDAVMMQKLSLMLQESWSPAGSPEHEALRQLHLQQRYLTVASNRARGARADRDAEARAAAMRREPREEDVERAMLRVYHEPLDRPAEWRSPDGEE